MDRTDHGSIQTIRERCRVCYTCIRECPAKAIRIYDGQAEVLSSRCIGCGNCIRVCSQGAKRVLSSLAQVRSLLADRRRSVMALVAPSWPAEFIDGDERQLAGLLRTLGFAGVYEVAFGAELVARAYRERLATDAGGPWIASACPAVVLYVEKYFPQSVPALIDIVSPMVAMARVVRRLHQPRAVRIVFIGPCIAKKSEGADELLPGELDAVLTFAELRELAAGHDPATIPPADFDRPRAGLAGLFPIARGSLQAAGITEDLLAEQVLAAEGRLGFADVIQDFEAGAFTTRFLEVLACDGCLMGAGMTTTEPRLRRQARIVDYVRRRLREGERTAAATDLDKWLTLDLHRRFAVHDQRLAPPGDDELGAILARLGKQRPEDELNCGACGYDTCRQHALAIHRGLAESEMCLPFTIERLRATVTELEASHAALAETQAQLLQHEKLASMGQLAAGVAHEVNNPLAVVLMYAHLLIESTPADSPQRADLELVVEQADRCKKIVAGLLNFARQNQVRCAPHDLHALIDTALRQCQVPATVVVERRFGLADPVASVDADQMVQVILNLVSNAVAAMEPAGGTLTVSTAAAGDRVVLRVADTGSGIPPANRGKIFEPFFTTKQIGRGTGLGLAIVYGIVKMHRGEITLVSNDNPAAGPRGSTFTVTLPRKGGGDGIG
jgi:signal transduction histidine kinase/iron only hydrogenase large subunit-like protein